MQSYVSEQRACALGSNTRKALRAVPGRVRQEVLYRKQEHWKTGCWGEVLPFYVG